MDHLAILAKKRKLLSKIISGEKTVESRWYKFKRTPYDNISAGDMVYFKDSGDPATVKAKVSKVLFFQDLNLEKIKEILEKYGKNIGIPSSYAPELAGKNFCTLIFLNEVEEIKPFQIDKTGYGLMAAWITIDDIRRIKLER